MESSIYLTVGQDEKGKMLAIISQGQPQLGDQNVIILDVKRVKNMKEARAWYRQMRIERPWETRQ